MLAAEVTTIRAAANAALAGYAGTGVRPSPRVVAAAPMRTRGRPRRHEDRGGRARSRRPSAAGGASRPAAATARRWRDLHCGRGLERESGGLAPVGIGMPGRALSPRHGPPCRTANSVWLNGRLRSARTSSALLHRPPRFANGAGFAARCRNARRRRRGSSGGLRRDPQLFGTGGASWSHGQVLGGRRTRSPASGATVLPWPRRRRVAGHGVNYCGRTGCVETFLPGPEGPGTHREATWRGARRDATPSRRGPPRRRRHRARRRSGRYEERPRRALAAVVKSPRPDVIVLRRRLSNLTRLTQAGAGALGRLVFSDRVARLSVLRARRRQAVSAGPRGSGRRRGRREAQPVAAAYRLTPVVAWPTRSSGDSSGLGVGPPRTYLLTVPGVEAAGREPTPVTLVEREGGAGSWPTHGAVGWVRNARAAGRVTLSRGRQRRR